MFARGGDPLSYPGTPPREPCLLLEDEAWSLSWEDTGRVTVTETGARVDSVLERRGAAPLSERTPQIAYGANRDIRNLAWKLKAYAQAAHVSRDVVIVPVHVPDADVVACNIGYWGYVYAALCLHRPPELDRPYLRGASMPAALLLLDRDQVHAMHRSEGVPLDASESRAGVSCDVASAACTVDASGEQIDAQSYVLSLPFMSFDGGRTPAPFAAVSTGGVQLPRYTEAQLWSRIFDTLDLGREFESVGALVNLLKEGASSRQAGDPGTSGQSRHTYEYIRERISHELALVDCDGRTRTGSDDCPGLLPLDAAWAGEPALPAAWHRSTKRPPGRGAQSSAPVRDGRRVRPNHR